MTEPILRSLGTHDGTFHADEVTAAALLLEVQRIDEDKIVRTRDKDLLEKCEYVCDVGGIFDPNTRRFDHHQAEYKGLLSSAGMILRYLEEQGDLSQQESQMLKESLFDGIDDHDNGRIPDIPGHCTFSQVIANYNPIQRESGKEIENQCFVEALCFARGFLRKLRERFSFISSCQRMVQEAMVEAKEKDYLIFKKNIPWIENFFQLGGEDHPARFVIMPTGKHWKLRGIPPSFAEKMKVRHPLPQRWAGLLEKDLKEASGIAGAVFCHKGRFISVWESLDDALQAYELSK